MHYHRFKLEWATIEFFNNWAGEETVVVNGQEVSRKSSVWGTNHYFTIVEDGREVHYILTTKVNSQMQVALDLSRNGELLEADVPVPYGSKPGQAGHRAKQKGIKHLQEYELPEALAEFEKALQENPRDAEIHFHMACAYSVLEKPRAGLDCLKKAVELSLQNQEMILTHDMLAFIRMHPAFAGFEESGFREYDEELMADRDDY